MCRFIETIRLESGSLHNLPFHQARMDRAAMEILELKPAIDLLQVFGNYDLPSNGLYKVRIVYGKELHSVEIAPYGIRSIKQMKIVFDDSISYDHKFENRKEVKKLFDQKGDCDDIVIIKNNQVTDASYANLVFRRNGQWVTPSTYLLNGTMRQQLLDKKIIVEERISICDLVRYERVKLINALVQFDGPEIDVSQIVK